MAGVTTRVESSHPPGGDRELGVDSVCCLLHNLIPGGSARQWVHLLARHVEDGGQATIVAPRGPLSEAARRAGIVTVDRPWSEDPRQDADSVRRLVARHDAVVVHWDDRVMHSFGPALAACGRATLVLHQTAAMYSRWFGPEILTASRVPIELALENPHGTVLVRGDSHRRIICGELDLPAGGFRVLPAAIPVPPRPPDPAAERPQEVLALTRLSHEKAAIVRLAAELTRARLDRGLPCHLSIAGDGEWRAEAISLCESILPEGAWRLEISPRDPFARLAAADLVVAQGQTTLEAAALERRVVVARTVRRLQCSRRRPHPRSLRRRRPRPLLPPATHHRPRAALARSGCARRRGPSSAPRAGRAAQQPRGRRSRPPGGAGRHRLTAPGRAPARRARARADRCGCRSRPSRAAAA